MANTNTISENIFLIIYHNPLNNPPNIASKLNRIILKLNRSLTINKSFTLSLALPALLLRGYIMNDLLGIYIIIDYTSFYICLLTLKEYYFVFQFYTLDDLNLIIK
jgi:hypothetical protein